MRSYQRKTISNKKGPLKPAVQVLGGNAKEALK
jgi:hypothetical protein